MSTVSWHYNRLFMTLYGAPSRGGPNVDVMGHGGCVRFWRGCSSQGTKKENTGGSDPHKSKTLNPTLEGDVDEFFLAQPLIHDPIRRCLKGWAQPRRNGAWGLRAVLEEVFQPGHQKIKHRWV